MPSPPFHRSALRTPTRKTRTSPVAVNVKWPPEPKSRVTDQRTPKLSDGTPETGLPGRLWLMRCRSQSSPESRRTRCPCRASACRRVPGPQEGAGHVRSRHTAPGRAHHQNHAAQPRVSLDGRRLVGRSARPRAGPLGDPPAAASRQRHAPTALPRVGTQPSRITVGGYCSCHCAPRTATELSGTQHGRLIRDGGDEVAGEDLRRREHQASHSQEERLVRSAVVRGLVGEVQGDAQGPGDGVHLLVGDDPEVLACGDRGDREGHDLRADHVTDDG